MIDGPMTGLASTTVRWLRAKCRDRFRHPNSITDEPLTIAACPSAAKTKRTAIA